jgi:hypothetical protein
MVERYLVRQVWCKGSSWGSPFGVRCVDAGHEFAVGGAGGGDVLVAFVALQVQINDLLLEVGDLLLERVDVDWVPSPDSRQACSPRA